MAKATVIIKDRNFRVVIPQAIRMILDLHIGDVLEIDIKKIDSEHFAQEAEREIKKAE